MSAVGLTKAMRAALEFIAECEFFPSDVSTRVFNEVQRLEFVESNEPCVYTLTPRGHAALAAPRMTVSQLALLEFLSTRSSARVTGAQWNVACNLKNSGFVVVALRDDRAYADITHPGLKALNDVRAATGSELYKDMP